MTKDDIKAKVADIAAMLPGNNEEAHFKEDALHQSVLLAIANGLCDDPAECADEALKIVEANSPEEAKELATVKFGNGDGPDLFGNEWEEIERFGEVTKLAWKNAD